MTKRPKRQTTEQWLCRLIHDSGPLGQAFLIDAIDKLTKQILSVPDKDLDEMFKDAWVTGEAWRLYARLMRDALDERLKEALSGRWNPEPMSQ